MKQSGFDSEHHCALDDLIEGLEGASARLAAAEPVSRAAFYSSFEALAWIGAIRDRIKNEGRPPVIVNGLYYARNVVLHQGADVLDWIIEHGLLPGPDLLPGPGVVPRASRSYWAWPSRDAIPTPTSMAGATDYDQECARKPALRTFQQATTELRNWRA